jgi:exodeoxyribonuclease V alpha subunit
MDETLEHRHPAPVPLEGILRRVVFRNPETEWCVIRLDVPGETEPVTAVGRLPQIHEGDRVRLQGRWETNRKFGRQFVADACVSVPPSTVEGLRRYLGSGRIPGIGGVLADRIVGAFGPETLEVIESAPQRLREVEGIGPERAVHIEQILTREKAFHQVMVFLRGHDVPRHLADRIHKRFGARSVDIIQEDPYRLCFEVAGVGFRTADRIARSLGFVADDPRRLRAGVLEVLTRGWGDGHVFLPRDRLLHRAAWTLQVEPDRVDDAVDELAADGRVIIEEIAGAQAVYHPDLHLAEIEVADRLRELLREPAAESGVDWEQVFHDLERRDRIRFADRQRQAIREAFTRPVMLITGGPGTGKTTLIRGILWILEQQGRRIELCAPTGRAAKRIRETTGREAKTIHRLLEFQPRTRSFLRRRSYPLDTDVVLIDESSMVDLLLAQRLLDAVPPGCQVVFVGDADQLPPVGPGNLLRDLIESGVVPIVRLSEVYRQEKESAIIHNAHRVRQGLMPETDSDPDSEDFFFIERPDPDDVVNTLRQLLADRIPGRFGADPVNDIQVLSPMHRGPIGVQRLNQVLQELLNPRGREIRNIAQTLRAGDKVMQIKNNYDREVFNGDIGRVIGIDPAEGSMEVNFDGRIVSYGRGDLDELTLAYACSVHKSQGSEYPVVVVILHPQHAVMLQRNLLYTAITRGRRAVIIVGTRKALEIAVRRDRIQKRYTWLGGRLRDIGE